MPSKILKSALLIIASLTFFANADIIELALVLDGSGSISDDNWELQVNAYKNIFADDFVDNFVIAGDELYVSVYQFSSGVQEEISIRKIGTNAEAVTFANEIGGLVDDQMGNLTYTAEAINKAAGDLYSNGIASDKMIIDISTDGVPVGNTVAQSLAAASNAYNSKGVTVNALGVGNVSTTFLGDLTTAGGGFYEYAPTFAEFEDVLRTKLHREIQGVPEPTMVSLLGFGLFSILGFTVRRKKK